MRSRWVHPTTHDIFKFMPRNPPEKGDIVLVDGERCEVRKAKVDWDGSAWRINGVKVKPRS